MLFCHRNTGPTLFSCDHKRGRVYRAALHEHPSVICMLFSLESTCTSIVSLCMQLHTISFFFSPFLCIPNIFPLPPNPLHSRFSREFYSDMCLAMILVCFPFHSCLPLHLVKQQPHTHPHTHTPLLLHYDCFFHDPFAVRVYYTHAHV